MLRSPTRRSTAPAAGHDRVALAGNSFGAQVAVEAAVRHPDRVERIVLLAPAVDPDARSMLRQGLRWLRNVPSGYGHMAHYSGAPVVAQALRPFLDGGAPPG